MISKTHPQIDCDASVFLLTSVIGGQVCAQSSGLSILVETCSTVIISRAELPR